MLPNFSSQGRQVQVLHKARPAVPAWQRCLVGQRAEAVHIPCEQPGQLILALCISLTILFSRTVFSLTPSNQTLRSVPLEYLFALHRRMEDSKAKSTVSQQISVTV